MRLRAVAGSSEDAGDGGAGGGGRGEFAGSVRRYVLVIREWDIDVF